MSDEKQIDWRKILIAYIDHVQASEGTTFLPAEDWSVPELSADELAALNKAAE